MSSFDPTKLTLVQGATGVPKTLGGRLKPAAPVRAAIMELDCVTLAHDVEGDDGERVPAGSTGTVVGVWAGGAAFEVEFADPVSSLATVKAEAIASHQPRR